MPKVTYSKTKGLIQETGNGFVMAAESVSGTIASDPGVALTIATTTSALDLADGSTVGQLKWIVGTSADSVVITPATTAGSYATVTLTNIGDSCCFVWTAVGWAVLSRASGTAAGATAVVDMPILA